MCYTVYQDVSAFMANKSMKSKMSYRAHSRVGPQAIFQQSLKEEEKQIKGNVSNES